MKYVLVNPASVTGNNPLTGTVHNTLNVGDLPVAEAGVDIYALELACHRAGLRQMKYQKNESAREKMKRAELRLERAKLALYEAGETQNGQFEALMGLKYTEVQQMLQTVEPFDRYGAWNVRRYRRATFRVRDQVKAVPATVNIAPAPIGPFRPIRLKNSQHRALIAELFIAFPFNDAVHLVLDTTRYGRAVDRWTHALHHGAPRVMPDGKIRNVTVAENLLLRPEVACNLAPTGVLMTAPEEALLGLLQEQPVPLDLTTANKIAEGEAQTFAHGERDPNVPGDLLDKLPPLQREVGFVPPAKGQLTRMTERFRAEGHTRAEARAMAKTQQAEMERQFRESLGLQLMAAEAIAEDLRVKAHRAIEASVQKFIADTGHTAAGFITNLVTLMSVTGPAQLKVKKDQQPELVEAWKEQGDHTTWPTLQEQYTAVAKGLYTARKAHAAKMLKSLDFLPEGITSGVASESITDLAGAKLLIEQEGLATPELERLARWVDEQERLVDRRVAYGRDTFVPDFIEVAVNATPTRRKEIRADVEALTQGEPYTLVLGTHFAEIPVKTRMNTIRKMRKNNKQLDGVVISQDDLLTPNPSITFNNRTGLPKGMSAYLNTSEYDLGHLDELNVAFLIAHAREVRVSITTPATVPVHFQGQSFITDKRHAALFATAASFQNPESPTVEVIAPL